LDFTIDKEQLLNIKVYNVLGQAVFSNTSGFIQGSNKKVINTSDWAPGLYVVEIGNTRFNSMKLVVTH
jgi:hypothetical protein